MIEYRYQTNDYLLTITYQGRQLTYRLKQYHIDQSGTYWHMYTKTGIHDLQFSKGNLCQILQHGETGFPERFLQTLQEEFHQFYIK